MTETETKTAEAANGQEGAAGENPPTPPAINPPVQKPKAPEPTGKKAAPAAATPPAPKVTKVRVVCDGPLGPLLLEKGTVTKDPRYVAILDTPGQSKVEPAK